MRNLKLGLPLTLLVALAACSSAQSAPADATDAGGETPATSAPTTDSDGDAGGDGGQAGGDYDACLNSNDEVSAAFGVEVTEAENTVAGVGASCMYYTNKAAFEMAMATTLQDSPLTVEAADSYFEDAEFEEISGIGDRAGWYEPNKLLLIVKGDVLFSMSAGMSVQQEADAPIREMLEELARLAADDL